MLQAIRDKAHGIFAWVMLIMVGIPFGLWGINNYFEGGKEKPVAVVGDREIYERDVNRNYENLVARMSASDYDEKRLRREALEQIINDELISQNARSKKLTLSDVDVRAYVQAQPFFETEGKFDKEKLDMMLASQGLTPPQFTAQVTKQLLNDQVLRGIAGTAFVTKQQLESFYRLRNQERSIEYFTLPMKKVDVEIADQEVEAYYRENKAQFQNPEKVSVEYISLTLDAIGNGFKPTDEELKTLYEEQKSQFGDPERRKVSHILISADVDQEDSVRAAEEKVKQIRERLVKGEEFFKVANEVSDDKESAVKGGDLGFVKRETLDPNFANAAFALARDVVSEPVKTPFGFHLIKVTELVPSTVKKFEEVREELVRSYQRTAAENKFYDERQKLDELSFEHSDSLEAVAKMLNLKIEQTGLFTREAGEGEASEPLFRSAAFGQDVLDGKNSSPVEIGSEKVYVLHLKEHQMASDKPLAEVKQVIIAQIRARNASEATRKQAELLLEEARQGKSMADLAKSVGGSATKTLVKLVGKSELPPELISAVNKAPLPNSGKPSVALAALGNGDQVLFSLYAVKDGSVASVDPKELELARDYLSKNEGQAQLSGFLGKLREQSGVKTYETD